ncbi:MAG: carbonic anhydrase family protein [Sneathiella sp.]|nr:carbonic anhydrase family protein [Sneathiella sp.]
MHKITLSTFMALLLISGGAKASDKGANWSYGSLNGPYDWPGICQEGKNQSPIDISEAQETALPPLTFKYGSKVSKKIHNGHAIQLEFEPGNKLRIGDQKATLLQAHFHSPSEHTIDGKHFPLEAHFVHQASDNSLIVVAVLYEVGAENRQLAKIVRNLPKKQGAEAHQKSLRASQLLPGDLQYFQYNGSLTTPPCTEGVKWIVLKSRLSTSNEQIKTFQHSLQIPTNRPVQPQNARTILK